MALLTILAVAAFAVWVYLIACRGGFWLAAERDDGGPAPSAWPAVIAVIPGARRGRERRRKRSPRCCSRIIPAPSRSCWSTTRAATAPPTWRGRPRRRRADRLTVVPGRRSAGGLDRQALGDETRRRPRADERARAICCSPTPTSSTRPTRSRASSRSAEADRLALNSLMVQLRCESFAERAFVPAFVFFFQMLYPFAWVNDRARQPRRRRAAACWCAARRSTRPAASRPSAAR